MLVNQAFAKEVAIDFLKRTNQELDPMMIGRVVRQVKMLLTEGYSEDEICFAIDFVLKHKTIYSFGYIEKSMEDLALKYRAEVRKDKVTKVVDKMKEEQKIFIDVGSEVEKQDETSERNRRKAQRFGVKPDIRKKSYFDLFEE